MSSGAPGGPGGGSVRHHAGPSEAAPLNTAAPGGGNVREHAGHSDTPPPGTELPPPGAEPLPIWIEPMGRSDIDRCVDLEQVLFPEDDPWPDVAFHSELDAAHNRYLVARLGGPADGSVRDQLGSSEPPPSGIASGRVVGYAGIALLGTLEHPEAEIHTIGVDPHCHRGGIGTALLRALLTEAGKRGGPVFLEVRTDNAPAIALYEKYGFHIIGLRKKYYQPSGADAFTMRRPALSGITYLNEVLT